jgi:hypothetical protein
LLVGGNDYGYLIDDEDILSGYRVTTKVKRQNLKEDDEELSDYVKLRLFIARELAMSKFREVHEAAVT